MRVYLASPESRAQAETVKGMPVLLSFALFAPWHYEFVPAYSHLLIDSGAFSELTGKKKVDLSAYADWAGRWRGHCDALAGLDDIRGNWRRSLANYEKMPDGLGFPTFHDTDPPELLDDLIPIARSRGGWLGIGLKPPRQGKERFVRDACDRIPDDLHVHGWALRLYTNVRRLNSVDSTNWWRDGMKLKTNPELAHLTYGECLEIVVKRYQRWQRVLRDRKEPLPSLFDGVGD